VAEDTLVPRCCLSLARSLPGSGVREKGGEEAIGRRLACPWRAAGSCFHKHRHTHTGFGFQVQSSGAKEKGGEETSSRRRACRARGSEAGLYLRLIDFVYHSTLGLIVIEQRERRFRGWGEVGSRPAAEDTPVARAARGRLHVRKHLSCPV